ncbi:MAG: TonB-dependent receptor [Prolixibacteraceae bacterium]|nr:TonB-dependent receptor [Prolixibacteraceae bacterium]
MRYTLLIIFILITRLGWGQHSDANIFGDVQSKGEHLPFVNIYVEETKQGTTTDKTGHYMLIDLKPGDYTLVAKALGYKISNKKIKVEAGKTIEINFELEEETLSIDQVVVTGTKTFKRSTESPVIVNVLDAKTIEMIQANTLSEGLNFQPGLRMEVDCQTCNYTQLRMNGLGGSYSQILINGRPVFSPLTGLYGLEQIPSNMIERIEIVRGGGSALYGSSAIGGTVNVITKIPDDNAFQLAVNNSLIAGTVNDLLISGNANVLTTKRNAGIAFFASRRERGAYDHNGDRFSELPEMQTNSFGFTSFFKPTPRQKIEFNLSSIYEYRYGGEMEVVPAHQAQQSEERTHNILSGGLDYQLDFQKSSLIVFVAGQQTKRRHYTGILPDTKDEMMQHFLNPPYGTSLNTTWQGGLQVNHRIDQFLGGVNVLTLGSEVLFDDVYDEIAAYEYKIDQQTSNAGMFVQSDWNIVKPLTLLTGIRFDKHSLVDQFISNPRISLLYRYKENTQLRASWAAGFRAPQAFDSDMHIAFAGGGVSRIRLADDLKEERSNSLSLSLNYDRPTEMVIWGFTLEGFHTQLNNAFVLEELGSDEHGVLFEKRNASASTVQGSTIEGRFNYNRRVQLETGLTLQTSQYRDPVTYSSDLAPMRKYLRTPNRYGYYTLTFTPDGLFNCALSGIYTGPMEVLHAAGSPELSDIDELFQTPVFWEHNIKIARAFRLQSIDSEIEISGGVKNLLNAYQNDFDTSKNRDSNYIYGPATPRLFYIGLKIKSL